MPKKKITKFQAEMTTSTEDLKASMEAMTDGENPRLWRDCCVLYFEVYGTHPTMMTRFAALNFRSYLAADD